MREGLPSLICRWWTWRRWCVARRRVREMELAWQRVGCDYPPATVRYIRALERELYWRRQLRSLTP